MEFIKTFKSSKFLRNYKYEDFPYFVSPETWYLLSIVIAVYGTLVMFLPKVLPNTLLAIFRYGKAAQGNLTKGPSILDLLLVPKRWFTHFYVVACTFYTFLLWTLFHVYFRRQNCPELFKYLISYATPHLKTSSKVLPEDLVVAMILMTIQTFRRLYECIFINIPSNAKMSVLHYLYGMIFYFAIGLSLVSEAPGFHNNSSIKDVLFTGAWLTSNHVLGAIIFLFGWCVQFDSHLILGNLRRNPKEKVLQYAIPYGGFFHYVSCPHYFGEVIMYFAIFIVFGGQNWTWLAAFLNVLINQIFAALMSHKWYKDTFKMYPIDRKAIIPFVL